MQTTQEVFYFTGGLKRGDKDVAIRRDDALNFHSNPIFIPLCHHFRYNSLFLMQLHLDGLQKAN